MAQKRDPKSRNKPLPGVPTLLQSSGTQHWPEQHHSYTSTQSLSQLRPPHRPSCLAWPRATAVLVTTGAATPILLSVSLAHSGAVPHRGSPRCLFHSPCGAACHISRSPIRLHVSSLSPVAAWLCQSTQMGLGFSPNHLRTDFSACSSWLLPLQGRIPICCLNTWDLVPADQRQLSSSWWLLFCIIMTNWKTK